MRSKEELLLAFRRLQAVDDCRNLMSRYIYLHNMERHREYAEELWSHRPDCVLQMPWARYDGWEGVAECYIKDHGDVFDKAEKNGTPMVGPTMYSIHPLDTEVIEVAADGKTAKGCWLSYGHESWSADEPMALPAGLTPPAGMPGGPSGMPGGPGGMPGGPGGAPKDPEPKGRFEGKKATRCITAYSKYSVDFILDEDGVWRIWKMQLYPLFKCSRYVPWTEYPQKMPKSHTNSDAKADGSGMVYIWGKDVVYPPDQPQPPRPYETDNATC